MELVPSRLPAYQEPVVNSSDLIQLKKKNNFSAQNCPVTPLILTFFQAGLVLEVINLLEIPNWKKEDFFLG